MDSWQWTRKSSFKVCGLEREVKRTTPKTWWVGQGLVTLCYAPQFLWWTTRHRNIRFLTLTTNSPDYLWVFLSSNIKVNPSFDVFSESSWTLCHPSEPTLLTEGRMNRKPKCEHLKPLISATCGIKSSLDWCRSFFIIRLQSSHDAALCPLWEVTFHDELFTMVVNDPSFAQVHLLSRNVLGLSVLNT